MKLNEKIYQCRRKAGLSQEALAEKIGVSRQAISKWETGEALPEIQKLPLLARTFGVTADWLLSEEDAVEAEEPAAPQPGPGVPPDASGGAEVNHVPDWVDKLPGFLSRMIRRYGWIIGVRIAVSGALFTAMGFVAKVMFSSMAGGFHIMSGNVMPPSSLFGDGTWLNEIGGAAGSSVSFSAGMTNPADILCNFIIGVGVTLLIGGAALAWYLKRKGSEN